MASELTLEQLTWHQLECAANSAGGIEVAMVSLPIAQVKALVDGRNTRPTPVAPVSPDATGKCGELVTVGYAPSEYGIGLDFQQLGISRLYPKSCASGAVAVVTRSQAEELLAAERAHSIGRSHDLAVSNQKRRDLEADNAALTARVKHFEDAIKAKGGNEHSPTQDAYDLACKAIDKHRDRVEALEAKLTAAEQALEPFAAVLEDYDPDWEDDDVSAVLVVGSVTHYGVTLGDFRQARAALGGKP